jgi:hypothetical protein
MLELLWAARLKGDTAVEVGDRPPCWADGADAPISICKVEVQGEVWLKISRW